MPEVEGGAWGSEGGMVFSGGSYRNQLRQGFFQLPTYNSKHIWTISSNGHEFV